MRDPASNKRGWACLFAIAMCGLVTYAAVALRNAIILGWYVVPFYLVYEVIIGKPLIRGKAWRWLDD